jgi:hypothetical protein
MDSRRDRDRDEEEAPPPKAEPIIIGDAAMERSRTKGPARDPQPRKSSAQKTKCFF